MEFYQQQNQENIKKQDQEIEQNDIQNQYQQIQQYQQVIFQSDFVEEVNQYTENEKEYINEYEITEKQLGRGSYGRVELVIRNFYDENQNPQQEKYAMKVINKYLLDKQRLSRQQENGEIVMLTQLDLLYEEMQLYQYLDHPNICKLFQIIDNQDHQNLYFILEYCDLGQICVWNEKTLQYDRNPEILNFIMKKYKIQDDKIQNQIKNNNNNQELQQQYSKDTILKISQIIFFQVLQGVKYLHSQNIINRDIKPDNILCKSYQNQDFQDIQICDFSTAKQLEKENQLVFDCVGTSGIRPPEMQFSTEGYLGKPSDIWSIGISLYCFINGKMPWWGESELELDIKSKKEEIKFDKDIFSDEVIDLIQNMCFKKQEERYTIQQCENHKFFQNIIQ